MPSSNSYNFSVTRSDIIEEAYELAGMYSEGDTLSSDDISVAARKLNMMVKGLMARGIHLWGITQATLFLVKGTGSYSIGPTGTHCSSAYVNTTLSAAAASGATSITMASTTGMSASDNIGILLDDGTIHWTTISGAPGSPTTIASGLASAAASGNVVFTYTSKVQRPNRIIVDTVYRRDINNNDIPIELVGRTTYLSLTSKTSQGKAVQCWYDPTLTNGTLYLWPTPNLATDVIRFSFERPFQDFDAAGDEPDFPIEWAEPLAYGLGTRLGFGLIPPERYRTLKLEADEKMFIAMGFDRENASIFFAPDIR